MRYKLFSVAALGLAAATLWAQVEILPEETQKEWLDAFEQYQKDGSQLTDHLKRLTNAPANRKIAAARVADDFSRINTCAPVLHYRVPAMSETQYLPDVYPFDGEAGQPVRIIAAQDEYEPGAFLLYPLKDFGKVQFEVGDLKATDGTVFSKKDLDLKVIKVWYQNGNGWYSYFQDKGLKLCPELLLNDEDLIKVDTENVCNWARLTDKNGKVSYRWLNPPMKVDNRIEDAPGYRLDESFCCMRPEFADAKEFKGAALKEGEFKQFFLTAHVNANQKPGVYSGGITLKKDGKVIASVPVELRVLPFVLPKPKTYFDLNKDFLMFMCDYISIEHIRQINGNDPELAKKQLVSLLRNFAQHGEVMPHYRGFYFHPEWAREAGCDFSAVWAGHMHFGHAADMEFDMRRQVELRRKLFSDTKRSYIGWGDEYGLSTLRAIRPMVEIYQNAGFLFPVNSRSGYEFGAYLADLFWPPVTPDLRSSSLTFKYNNVNHDGHFGWYAAQHVGVENPAFIRRQYGLGPYRAGLSCHFNYAHHLNGYNDYRGGGYKPMNFIYGDGNGVLNTLSYEAFREGMDDIRYATKLMELATKLEKSKDLKARYAARKAFQLLADLDADNYDVSTARLEIIRHILNLQTFSK